MQEEGDVAELKGDAEQGEEVEDTKALHLPITCIHRCNREDVVEDAATAVMYP